MGVLKFLMNHKKKMMAVLIALVLGALSVFKLIPGDNPDMALEKAADFLKKVDEKLPADPEPSQE